MAEDVLDVMVKGTRGYPFLIQLVGSQVWRLRKSEREISMESAREGVSDALRRLGRLVMSLRSPTPRTSTSPSCSRWPRTTARRG